MPMFEERERAYEAKFAHDQEFRFLVTARRDKVFAHRIAAQLGWSGAQEERLVGDVLAVPDGPAHDAALLGHMQAILTRQGRGGGAGSLATLLEECNAEAKRELLAKPHNVQ